MPTSARLEVANSPQITVKTVQSAGSMRRPQASFEAQPRIARLLAPKMGIDPYRQVGKCIRIRPGFPKKALHPAGGQSRPPLHPSLPTRDFRAGQGGCRRTYCTSSPAYAAMRGKIRRRISGLYLSCRQAMPGSSRPSRNSRDAPPPVEM